MISGQLDTQQRTHLEVGGDVGQLEVLGEVKLRQVAHVGEVEHLPVLRTALGAAVQRRHVLARGSYTDQSLKRRLNEGSRRFHNHGEDPYKAFSWLKVPTSASTFKTLF